MGQTKEEKAVEKIIDTLIDDFGLDVNEREHWVRWFRLQLRFRSERLIMEIAQKAVDASAIQLAS